MSMDDKALKKKQPKKVVQILKKKPTVVIGVAATVAIAGIIGGILIFVNIPEEKVLYISYARLGIGIDPHQTWAPTDYEIINQVAEGLFIHDSVNGHSRIINNLAINHSWNENATEYNFELRQDVEFHDGNLFNAEAVQWNIERIYTLIDNGKMHFTKVQDWLFSDGSRIINHTQIINNYTIKFVLNKPYIPLTALLASTSSSMISPFSAPNDDFLDHYSEDLIGTGPFLYDLWNFNQSLILSSNPNYWGQKPQIDKLIFKFYGTHNDKFDALLSGELSMLSGYNELYSHGDPTYWDSMGIYDDDILDVFIIHPDIIVEEGPPSTFFDYFLMNNELINVTMRKAISYAFNYSAYIDKGLNGHVTRLRSPIPEGILYSNTTEINVPYYNITMARQTLKDVNWNGIAGALTANDNITVGNEWEKLLEDGTPVATYNFSYIAGMLNGIILLNITRENLKQIGIKIEAAELSPGEFVQRCWEIPPYHLNMFELSWMGYIPRFNDPSSIINFLCSNKALDFNYCQINDSLTQDLMELAISETNETARKQLYYQIQKRLIEEIFPMCYLLSRNCFKIYRSNLKGLNVNHFNPVYNNIYFI